ncbi:NUDIX hydrolase [Lewinella sp. W8]|uniref:NUDIX hydrolase n=1 Tax=Lewinella sp. W8 TaxID=2528208 RepID=UPI001067F7FF|nr:NUDIX domain-containing protein [Lewinella sp. W8]MTB52275.1 NUDIX domain-containing protein [Lewinella sp. W8]
MYVIYINDRPLRLLAQRETTADANEQKGPTHLTAHYIGKPRTLLNYVDMLEKGSPKVTSVDIVGPDLEALWTDFRSHFRWLPAAGGVVTRSGDAERPLFIFRRGFWDLPKGKIDPGESPEAAAVREVEEETGLRDISLLEQLPTTYHTYRNRKEKRVLKPTYWYRMEAPDQKLIPQAEEDIELAEWRTITSVLEDAQPIYASLAELLNRL